MASAQLSSAELFLANRTAVLRGRGFQPGTRLSWRSGSRVLERASLYATGRLVVAQIPSAVSGDGSETVAVLDPDGVASRFAPLSVQPETTVEQVLAPGERAAVPFRLVFVANPFLKENGRIKRDPIIATPEFFLNRVTAAIHDLFDRTPTEFLTAPAIRDGIRVSSVFDASALKLRVRDAPEQHVLCTRRRVGSKYKIEASRRRVNAYLADRGAWADVAIVFSRARSSIPTAWFGTDNYARGGVPFTFDGREYLHAFYSSLQGVAAFSTRRLRPFEFRHEFLHASSAFNSGQVLDEYDLSRPFTEPGVPDPFAINKKLTPATAPFAEYHGRNYPGMSLGSGSKKRFVPATAGTGPCIMNRLAGTPRFDPLIAEFMRDRFSARLSRQF